MSVGEVICGVSGFRRKYFIYFYQIDTYIELLTLLLWILNFVLLCRSTPRSYRMGVNFHGV